MSETLHPTGGYEHVTIVEAGRTAYLAGQCPVDADENVVGVGDLEAQIEQTAANCLAALKAAGARPEDVVRSIVYVVSSDSKVVGGAWHRFFEHRELGPAFNAASTVVGVTTLGYAGQLVEVDLTARLPN
ncbi:RidA family protein [Glycomyces harbinensis]|uniref:Enamine deaminase RidA, house cleaning of reactive enamine intermediates, YjgF/YER057c/UK114 family n=1 Tax=Glycomyces harbinensis TaxID=58114 RepID=A0A1G6Z682_9ACTN|nr:RidA family protein [Glycomyces harbinensis]SDD98179.1 Enamine deaminase RidA, house cleaning of reactive enamine intermediates, YjgF/YER057c/UK114 family [Glycomyces harbinensis]